MTNARRSAGLRRVSTATYGLVAASVTGVAVVTGVVAHQGVHHGTSSPTAQTDDGSSTGSAPASQSAINDDALGSDTLQSPAAVSPAVQSPVQSPAQQQPAQVLPAAPAPVVGPVSKRANHHAVTSGS
jgi:hypothetical protein